MLRRPRFVSFAAACNARPTEPAPVVRSCHWGLQNAAGADEIRVVLDSSGGFLALKMGAERLVGPGVLRLQGLCVDQSPYRLSP